jgi:cellobiose-specific phosphotransferase system component IIA
MVDIQDIRDSLQDQIVADAKELEKIKKAMKRIRAAHQRYLDLLERAKQTEERVLAAASVLHQDRYSDTESMKEFLAERGIEVEQSPPQKQNL